jgi:membrane protein implicated in regulation of membrane protease activity
MARPAGRPRTVQRPVIARLLSDWFAQWAAEVGSLSWLAVALVAAVLEVSVPHFGCAFVSAGAIAAAAAAFFGFGIAAQIGTFVLVMTVSLIALRQNLLARLGGQGMPSRTDSLVGRQGQVTHDIDPTIGSGRINVGGEDWAARSVEPLAVGTKIRVVAADGIVLEVTRA